MGQASPFLPSLIYLVLRAVAVLDTTMTPTRTSKSVHWQDETPSASEPSPPSPMQQQQRITYKIISDPSQLSRLLQRKYGAGNYTIEVPIKPLPLARPRLLGDYG